MRRDVVQVVETMLRSYPQLKGQGGKAAQLWCAAIDETLDERPERRRFVEMRYFMGMREDDVLAQLPLGRSCYRRWRDDVLGTVAAKAAYWQLIKP